MIPDFKTYLNESIPGFETVNRKPQITPVRKTNSLTRQQIEDFIDKSLDIYAELYVQEGWYEDGEELTYDIFKEVVKTSDAMQGTMAIEGIDDYEDYTEEQLDRILRYAWQKWDVYSKKLEEYRDKWQKFWDERTGE